MEEDTGLSLLIWTEAFDGRVIPEIAQKVAQGLLPSTAESEASYGSLIGPTDIVKAVAIDLPADGYSVEVLGPDWRNNPPEMDIRDGVYRVAMRKPMRGTALPADMKRARHSHGDAAEASSQAGGGRRLSSSIPRTMPRARHPALVHGGIRGGVDPRTERIVNHIA